jgi:TolB-like protein
MVATVSPWVDPDRETPLVAVRNRAGFLWAAVAGVCLAIVAAFLIFGKFASNRAPVSAAVVSQPEKSIAVLPFLDLTDKMSHEIFADGMTEELIDKFSKIPGLRVAAPRSSFLLKGKKMPIAEVGRMLGVAYVLDGSVRKSGVRMRVATRLIRADNGYVVWSQTYDRPWDDLLQVQEDIAGEVAKALRASIEAAPDGVKTP